MCPPVFSMYIYFILHITDVQNGISQNTSKHKLLLPLTQTVTHMCKADCNGFTSEIYLLYIVSWTIVIDRTTRDVQVCFPHRLPWPCKH